jgi:hypothetical protein
MVVLEVIREVTRDINRSVFSAESFDSNTPDFQQDPYLFYQWFRRYNPIAPVYENYNSYCVYNYERPQQQ